MARHAESDSAPAGERRYGKRPVSERRAERRAKLLDAALEAFGTGGYRSVSVEQICTNAGVSTRNFYEEFSNREDVIIELHDLVNNRAYAAVVDAVSAAGPADSADRDVLVRRVGAGTRAYFEVMTMDPRFARIALVESVGVSPRVDAARRVAISRFADFIEAEADRIADLGVTERRSHDLTAIAIVGGINELVNTWPERGEVPHYLDRLVDEATRLVIAVLTS